MYEDKHRWGARRVYLLKSAVAIVAWQDSRRGGGEPACRWGWGCEPAGSDTIVDKAPTPRHPTGNPHTCI
jgi:hypothetical protein